MTQEEILKEYPMLNHKDFLLTKRSIFDLLGKDKYEDDRAFMTETFDSWSDEDNDMFFYDMLSNTKWIEQGETAYTTPNRIICLSYPNTDIIPQDDLKFKRWYFVYCHECLHQLWNTYDVQKEIIKDCGKCDFPLLNIASDCVINDYLTSISKSHKTPPVQGIYPDIIEQDYGVKYDRKKDTQYSLYLKLKKVVDQQQDLMNKLKQQFPDAFDQNNQQGQQGQSGQGGQGGQSGQSGQGGQGGQGGNSPQDKATNAAQSAAQAAANAANAAQKAADKAAADDNETAANAAQKAADKAKKAAEKAADAAQAAADAKDKGDDSKLAAETQKAADAANEAAEAAKEAKEAAGIHDGAGKDGEGKDGAGKDSEGKDGAGKDGAGKDGEGKDGEGKDGEGKDGEGNGNNDSLENATKNAENAANNANKQGGGKKSSTIDGGTSTIDGGTMKGSKGASTGDSDISDAELEKEAKRRAEEICKKYSKTLSGNLSIFTDKCARSKRLENPDFALNSQHGTGNWYTKLEQECRSFIKQKLNSIKKYENTYTRVKRGERAFSAADLRNGRSIVPGRREVKQQIGFDMSVYIDVSGSMDEMGRINNVFPSAYSCVEEMKKTFRRDSVVDASKVTTKAYIFTTRMREIKWGSKCDARDGTYEFAELLRDVYKHGQQSYLNLIFTDGQFSRVDDAAVADTISKMEGLFVLVTTESSSVFKSTVDAVKKKCKFEQLKVIEADDTFAMK